MTVRPRRPRVTVTPSRRLHWREYAKALAAAAVGLVGALSTWAATYLPDDLDLQKWLGLAAVLVTVVAGGAVTYNVPNRPAPGVPSDPAVSEQDPEGGHAELGGLLYVVVVLVVLLVLLRIAHVI